MNNHSVARRGRRFSDVAGALAFACVLIAALAPVLHGQISEDDKKKRDAFLKAREEMHTVPSSSPAKESTAKPKPAKKKTKSSKKPIDSEDDAEPAKTPAPKKSAQSDEDEDVSPSPRARKSPTPEPTASARTKTRPSADEEDAPKPRATVYPSARPDDSTPPPRATVTPSRSPTAEESPADITIQKSGIEQEQGYEPPPAPPPKRGFFARLFGGGSEKTYRYLDRKVIDAIRNAPVQRSRWKFIIVHNSGTKQGNARAFDYYHRNVRHMQNGLAYHFVVGNGTSSGNGQVEIGDRWRRQINGGHVHSDYLNNISLGICLVGDFNHAQPTKAQLDATEELIRYLRDRCGKADGQLIPVRPHREMNPPRWATDCPGDAFPYGWFHRF